MKVKKLRLNYSIEQICNASGYSRQGYYKRRKTSSLQQMKEKIVLLEIQNIRQRQPKVGGRKLYKMLKVNGRTKGIIRGRDNLFGLLRRTGLLVRNTKKYVRTTNSYHRFRTYKNLIKEMEVTRPGQVIVSDITYIRTYEGFSYLSLITDKYSRKIIGYELSKSLSIEGSMKALQMALRNLNGLGEIIHHSDRGIQYCSKAYVKKLKKNNAKISMTEENHVYENALAERVNGILKTEFMLGEKLISFEIAKKMVDESIKTYNEERLHMSLNYLTPEQKFVA